MTRPGRYPPELRERAVRLVFEHRDEHASQWAAITSIAHKFGISAETLRKWVRRLPDRRPVVVSRRIGLPAMNLPPMRPLVRRYSVTCIYRNAFATSCMPSSPREPPWWSPV